MDTLDPDRPTRIHHLDRLPKGLLDCPVNRLDTLLDGPTLIRLRGERQPPLFVSVLLHGNEVSGFLALQILLRDFHEKNLPLPRDLWIFVGNVEAARYGVRRLPGQPDYNRIWAGGEHPECRMAEQLLEELSSQPLFAALDVHNNSGRNPIYGCVNRLEPRYLNIARKLSSTLVYFTEPHEVLGMALSRLCPTATLECGISGLPEGINRVVRLVNELMAEDEISDAALVDDDLHVFHTVARITVDPTASLGFGQQTRRYDLCFPEELESLNFRYLPADTLLGWQAPGSPELIVTDNDGRDVRQDYIHYDNERILTRRPCLLSMLTADITVIHQDCLCYIMEPYPLQT